MKPGLFIVGTPSPLPGQAEPIIPSCVAVVTGPLLLTHPPNKGPTLLCRSEVS